MFSNQNVISFWCDDKRLKDNKDLLDSFLKDLNASPNDFKYEVVSSNGTFYTYDELFHGETQKTLSDEEIRHLQSIQHLNPQAKKLLRQQPNVYKPQKV